MVNKSDFEKIDKRLESISKLAVEEIEVSADLPPTIDQLQDSNKAYSIKAAILFIDIRKSTFLTESSQAKSMVKIYRAFMRMAVDCVRKNGGVTRQFLGDRIMGIFIDTYDVDEDLVESAVDKAVNCGRALLTLIDYSLNKHLKNNVNGKMIECGIGIDFGKILVTQVGMYGVENDEKKENEVDTVWVGNTTNFASKFSDSAEGGEIFISQNAYSQLSSPLKENEIWQSSARSKGNRIFNGYIAKDFYLDFAGELGSVNKLEQDNDTHQDTAHELAEGIAAIEKLLEKLVVREKELAVLEAELKKENQRLKEDNSARISAYNAEHYKRTQVENALHEKALELYNFIYSIIEKSHCKNEYIKGIGQEEWQHIINRFYQVGHSMGYSDEDITSKADCSLIGIYNCYEMYEKAFEATLVMARRNGYWVYIEYGTIKWACERNCIYKLEYEIQTKLDNFEIPYERRSNYQGYLQRIKGIRGY